MGRNVYDWKEIQEFYDAGHTSRDVMKKFGVTLKSQLGAKKRGDFVFRTPSEAHKLSRKKNPRKHTTATKKKLREHMLRRLEEGTYPTLGKNFRGRPKSYPEGWWKSVFDARFDNKGYTEEYQIGLYSLDYAWIDLKKVIEIDGTQHLEERQRASDERKDAFLQSQGWKVLRMPWKETVADKEAAILKAKEFIDGL